MTHPIHRRGYRAAVGLAAAALTLGLVAPTAPAEAAPAAKADKLANQLVKKSSGAGANKHLIAFQRIAEQNDGNRASGTSGYDASVDYVAGKLRAAGFEVSTPSYTYEEEVVLAEELTVGGTDFEVARLSETSNTAEGGTTGPLVVVPEDADTGCTAADYASIDATDAIVLIRRGGCTFAQKTQVAAGEGALAVIVSNNVAGPVNGTLGETQAIPAGSVTQADGTALAALAGEDTVLRLEAELVETTSRNVIAQTRTGSRDNVVMAGAHLDSVPEGAGINDNGSGSAGLLDVALQLGGSPKVGNAVRFAWWGSEELGLVGATRYVEGLSFEEQLDIALYLNFDMIGSPNAAYFVYDGDDSDAEGSPAGPFGSAQIEQTFVDFFDDRLGVPTQGTDFSGRSDYGPFIAVGIPSGGLFTGAEGIKTAEQAALWGGTAGVAYDPCYHQACDDLGNVDRVALDRNTDAIAWSVGRYAYSTEDVNGVAPAKKRQQRAAAAKAMAPMVAEHQEVVGALD